jgi:LPS sulfotransferase NodH
VDAVAALVGLAAPVAAEGKAMGVQRDETSDDWRERFVAERGDLSYLDDDRLRLGPRLRRLRSRFW